MIDMMGQLDKIWDLVGRDRKVFSLNVDWRSLAGSVYIWIGNLCISTYSGGSSLKDTSSIGLFYFILFFSCIG